MSSLRGDFDELRERIRQGRELNEASFEPIFYLVFPPAQILEVKRQLPAWKSSLYKDGWDVHTFSMAEQIYAILRENPRYPMWLEADRANPSNWDAVNNTLADALTSKGLLQERLESFLESIEQQNNSLAVITDLEALHPYLRIGAVESQLQGKFSKPTIFLYPGVRTGKSGLKFLGFYPADGNYRSVHVGG